MEYRGFVRGFAGYTNAQLLQMKQDLSLEMSFPMLEHCASYYRKLHRDPAIAELQMLDRFYQCEGLSAATCAVTELLTDQEFVAHTFSDLLQKRAELLPNANHPCTLEEAFYIATAYMQRGGKSAKSFQKQFFLENTTAAQKKESRPSCVFSPNEDSCLRILSKVERQKPATGDMLVLLTSDKAQNKSAYLKSVEKLLSFPEVQAHLLGHCPVSPKGLLIASLSMVKNGLWLELSRLSKVEEHVPINMLFDGYEGDTILRLSAKAPGMVATLATSLGLHASIFASVTNDGDLRISNQGVSDFRISIPFLYSLTPIRGFHAKLAQESGAPLEISYEKKLAKSLAYLPYLQETHLSSTYADGTITAVAQAKPCKDFFLHGVYTAYTAILTLALSGCGYDQQNLSMHVCVPRDLNADGAAGELLSLALGIYRTQAAYGIPAATLQITSANTDHPGLTAYSTGFGTPCPTNFIKEKSLVYLLRMGNTATGSPDFEDMRKIMLLLTELRQNGVLQSARILCNQSLTYGLDAMSKRGIRCHLRNTKVISEEREYFSVLLETTRPIAATYIGKTVKDNAPTTTDSPISPSSSNLIWAEKPEVLMLSSANDPAAEALAHELEKEGACVKAFTSAPSNANVFSRALLGAHVLILCKDARVQDTDSLRFAYQTFRSAGGKVLSVGSRNEEIADFSFPDGFSREDILKICAFEEKN